MKVYNKLVRDKIPEIIAGDNGKTCVTRIMADDEYLESLNTKIQEELKEYLESGETEELADLEAGTAVELKKLQFSDVTVPKGAFVSDTAYQDFPYRASIALSGAIESMIPEVVLSVDDALSGNYAPVAESYNGGVYLYAGSPPGADITIPTIIMWRGN